MDPALDQTLECLTEANRWVPNLSMDEPINEHMPWRLFFATAWLSTAVANALPDGDPVQVRPVP